MLTTMFALHSDDTGQTRRRPPAVWRTMTRMDQGLVALTGRLRITGRIAPELRGRPFLMASNHIGVFDPFVLIAACRRVGVSPRFLLAGGIMDAPLIGPALKVSGHMRIDRGKSTALEQFAQAVLGIADRAAIMVNGEVTHVGTPDVLRSQLSTAYLGG